MSSYSINPAGAIDMGVELIGVTKKMEQSLADLEAKANAFKAANDGQAVGGYDHAQRIWSAGQTEMNNSMMKGITALDEINQQYLHGDAQASAQFLS
jgi:uncharacterized protein YukE